MRRGEISIHAPREGSDLHSRRQSAPWGISIHAPREGSDASPARAICLKRYFNPRSPRGERHANGDLSSGLSNISIHAPREGSDELIEKITTEEQNFNPRSPRGERRTKNRSNSYFCEFQSTLPARGATIARCDGRPIVWAISIHAPREGSDEKEKHIGVDICYFNPRSPRGERQPGWCYNGSEAEFQSTLPARGATLAEKQPEQEKDISIHAPREGSDVQIIPALIWSSYFNPRSPRGERRSDSAIISHAGRISIHAPREGSDGIYHPL